MSDTLFYGTSLGIVVGIILFTTLQNTYSIVAGVFILLICFLFVGKFSKKFLVLLFVLVFSILVGYGVSYLRIPSLPATYTNSINKSVILSGKVVSVEEKNNIQNVLLEPDKQDFRVLVKLNNGNLSLGESAQISGILKYPENFSDVDGDVFDYVSYLKKDFIYLVLDKSKVLYVKPASVWNIKARLFVLKNKIEDQINNNLHEPQSGLARGILVGSRDWLTTDLRNQFVRSGTIHVIALSGYNITIVVEAMLVTLGAIFSVTVAWVFSLLGIVLFVIITGASTTAIRAGLMGGMVILAKLFGHKAYVGRVLVLTVVVMSIMNPFTILYDVSFQLSVLATVGLIYITPKILHKFLWVTDKFGIRDVVATTVGTNIAVLPLILYTMGAMSLVSIPANVLILPLMPLAMGLTFLLVLCFFIPSLSILFAFPLSILLSFILWVIAIFASIPFGVLNYPLPLWAMLCMYLTMFVILFKNSFREMFVKTKENSSVKMPDASRPGESTKFSAENYG
ncbi:MAG: ComEC/Rec2 family competence protein [Minisyncoccia bacterium]